MPTEVKYFAPLWFYGVLSVAALLVASAFAYRQFAHHERDWMQTDQEGTGEWAKQKLVVPRLFDRRTGEYCEYRGQGAKLDYTSQFIRGPWVCYPGPISN